MVLTEGGFKNRLIDVKSPVDYELLTNWLQHNYSEHYPEEHYNVYQEGVTLTHKDCIMFYDNGDVYIGPLTHGKKLIYKEGKMIFADGRVYQGQWYEDQIWGQGRMGYTDGTIYDGQWKEGRKEGNGKFKDLEGKVTIGYWSNDVMQTERIIPHHG